MKPLPEFLMNGKRYPPWWSLPPHPRHYPGQHYVRCDGLTWEGRRTDMGCYELAPRLPGDHPRAETDAFFDLHAHPQIWLPRQERNGELDDVAELEFIARLDQALPLPHPGWRTGQVWLFPFITEYREALLVGVDRDQAGTVICIDFARSIGGRSSFYPTDARDAMLLKEMDGILIADPARPQSAVWRAP